ncbi:hypothetical protein [Nitrosospira briensis]|uniref:hypothetical protein n=1 Tax=Nitrosospira briensis TaxID=35799 RepID=UPI0012E171AC|nr:hypothetical protein [Nitrosospira briensis]
MSWSLNTGDRYHTQDTSYYCGAACAMMILNEIGVSYADLDQDDLYTSNNSHNANPAWYTDPYGLCYTLNDRRPASFLPNYFVVHKRLTEAEGTRDVAFTLYHYKVSPAVLVYHCAHWNVVCGVQTDVDPTTGPYVIEGFWLNNPVWDSSISSHDGSDTCGSGGTHGVANEFVTYAEWQTNRFNGCAYDDPGAATQWISVCDPEPPTIDLPRRREVKRHGNGKRLIQPQQVAELASSGLKEYKLAENKQFEAAFSSGGFGMPQLVQRLDRPNDFYYLTPWEGERGISALVDIDARFGFFKSARVFSEPAKEWLIGGEHGAKSAELIARRVNDKIFELPGEKGRFKVYPGTYCITPILVWKPCRQSWSPHLPFYQLAIGGTLLYVRVDGEVFTQLTSGLGV